MKHGFNVCSTSGVFDSFNSVVFFCVVFFWVTKDKLIDFWFQWKALKGLCIFFLCYVLIFGATWIRFIKLCYWRFLYFIRLCFMLHVNLWVSYCSYCVSIRVNFFLVIDFKEKGSLSFVDYFVLFLSLILIHYILSIYAMTVCKLCNS